MGTIIRFHTTLDIKNEELHYWFNIKNLFQYYVINKCPPYNRSLRNLRGFIHVNLCINLAIAQIIFVAGVDKTSENSVPIHCKVIAVLLHYFFLVSFMWMLMEGVFLYLALVKIFINNNKRYTIIFTAVSYGLPHLYMCILTIPLGFTEHSSHYGYDQA